MTPDANWLRQLILLDELELIRFETRNIVELSTAIAAYRITLHSDKATKPNLIGIPLRENESLPSGMLIAVGIHECKVIFYPIIQ